MHGDDSSIASCREEIFTIFQAMCNFSRCLLYVKSYCGPSNDVLCYAVCETLLCNFVLTAEPCASVTLDVVHVFKILYTPVTFIIFSVL